MYVTLPLMCPSVKIVIVTGLIGGMKVFDIIYSMTSGGPGDATQTVMTVMMKKEYQKDFTVQVQLFWCMLLYYRSCNQCNSNKINGKME